MHHFAHTPQDFPVTGVTLAVMALVSAGLQDGLQVVENKQRAPLL